MQLKGNAENVGPGRALLGQYVALPGMTSTLRSVAWSAFGHGDVVFVVAGDWNPVSGEVHPGRFTDILVLRQALGEDGSPIEPLAIPDSATVQFLASAHSGADSAAFVAEVEALPKT